MLKINLNERIIQQALFRKFSRSGSDILMSNATPPNWTECDFLRLTYSGCWEEYEIKCTARDFHADFGKTLRYRPANSFVQKALKHSLLTSDRELGPSKYWFVVPENMVDLVRDSDLVDPYIGIMVARPSRWTGMMGASLRIIRKAKKRNNVRLDPTYVEKCRKNFYWRAWTYREKVISLQQELRIIKAEIKQKK